MGRHYVPLSRGAIVALIVIVALAMAGAYIWLIVDEVRLKQDAQTATVAAAAKAAAAKAQAAADKAADLASVAADAAAAVAANLAAAAKPAPPPPPPPPPSLPPGASVSLAITGLPAYLSPDSADGNTYRKFTLSLVISTVGVRLRNNSQTSSPRVALADDVAALYGDYWPDLVGPITGFAEVVVNSGQGRYNYTKTLANLQAPTQPGLFDNLIMLAARVFAPANAYEPSVQVVAATVLSTEVTCSALVVAQNNWCDGERRWIVDGKKCTKTYKPCGQETAAGVAQDDLCYVYPCYNNNRTCGTEPLGEDCAVCTQVGEPTPPNCTNDIDNSTRLCGDDGAGGECGACDDEDFPLCDPNLGQCVASVLGACIAPYPLFGNSLQVGNDLLNPSDQAGIFYYVLNNTSPDTVQPISPLITASTRGAYEATHQLVAGSNYSVPINGTRIRIFVDSSYYIDSITTPGNSPGVRDVSFKFTIPGGNGIQGMEAYLLDQSGDPTARDTFLTLVRGNCSLILDTDTDVTPADVYTSDDATPPGAYSSHITSTGLSPGSYVIVATTYSNQEAGPLWLEVVFTATQAGLPCTPICVGHLCGSNGCGGKCNVNDCGVDETCHSGICSACPANLTGYVPDCLGDLDLSQNAPPPYFNTVYTRNCGPDVNQCPGAYCGALPLGACPAGQICQGELGLCITVPPCDRNVPVCKKPKPKKVDTHGNPLKYFCGTLCEWVELNEPMVDIVPNNEDEVFPTHIMQWKRFDDLSCALAEKCVFGDGWRLIIRFDTNIHNIGTKTYVAPSPYERPDILVYALCHQHYHEEGFAGYYLQYPENGTVALNSTKKSYCVETSFPFQSGPKVPCTSDTTCDSQGLEPGQTDSYHNDLDCQWLDATQLYNTPGAMNRWYTYVVGVNQHRAITEYSYINNYYAFPLYLQCPPPVDKASVYSDVVADNPCICCTRPGGPDPVTCPIVAVNVTAFCLSCSTPVCDPVILPPL